MATCGRKCKFKPTDVIRLRHKAEEYFKKCDGEMLKDGAGDYVLDKNGQPIIVGVEPYTVTGVALALGFNSRAQFIEYQNREDFEELITWCKTKCEEYAEKRLYDRDGANGARFSLANNFKGWSDKRTIEADVKQEQTIVIDLVDGSDDA